MQSLPTVYGDKTVFINDLFIKIYKYYFPLATSKTIFFKEIDRIVYHPESNPDPLWGTTISHLNNWFPLDQLRKYKKAYFQIIMKDKTIRPSFSPIDPETALMVLWYNHSVEGKKQKEQFQKMKKLESTESISRVSSNQTLQIKQIKIEQKQNEKNISTLNSSTQSQDISIMNACDRGAFEKVQNINNQVENTCGKLRIAEIQSLGEEDSVEQNDSKRDDEQLLENQEFEDLN